ncbi:TMEM175 family protein [Streptomyces sp. NPDC014636]|uniref:TMEM175 family protein n=1 Tax=Streptomyces sp. NPDC014636 TaxID=3364876 RepID=UPI0036F72C6E
MNESGRVEAFSDGVFAIAITLLVLDIKVPEADEHGGLWHALGAQWPSYAAYVVSFLVVGIMWINHHQIFSHVARVDRTLMFLNLLLLMVVSAVPWPTAMLAEYLREGTASHAAAAVYSLVMVVMALAFQALWWHLTRTGHLFDADVDVTAARATRIRFALGSLGYPLAVGLAFVSAPVTLAAHGLLALYYGFNQVPVPTRKNPATQTTVHQGTSPGS